LTAGTCLMKSKICIVKFGSTSLVGDEYVSVEARIQNICQQIQVIRESGWQPVIVTSGAKALGKARYSPTRKVSHNNERQFYCALGQVGLMVEYDKHLPGQVAQLLITRDVFTERDRYHAMKDTIKELIQNTLSCY
jgi:glutamate 5-kinase